MSGLWTSHQKQLIISIHVGILRYKIPESGALGTSFCFVLVLVLLLWLHGPQASGMCECYHHHHHHPSWFSWSSRDLYKRLSPKSLHSPLPLLPHASKQMLVISSFISKTSHSTTITISQIPQSCGWRRRIRIPNHPPHCITWQNERRLTF